MQVKLSAENCTARLVIPAIAKEYVPAKIIVDTNKSDWNRDLYIKPKYNPMVLGTYIVNGDGKRIRAKDCVAYQGILDSQPLVIVKTLGVGQNTHLVFIKCEIDGRLIENRTK